MTMLMDVCRVRSKNAGPFWITIDLFFHDGAAFERHRHSPALSAQTIARILGTPPEHMRRFDVPDLSVLKFSFPRPRPQGGREERDMHGGQLYAPLLGLEL